MFLYNHTILYGPEREREREQDREREEEKLKKLELCSLKSSILLSKT